MLAGPVAFQPLKTVRWRHAQVVERCRGIDLSQPHCRIAARLTISGPSRRDRPVAKKRSVSRSANVRFISQYKQIVYGRQGSRATAALREAAPARAGPAELACPTTNNIRPDDGRLWLDAERDTGCRGAVARVQQVRHDGMKRTRAVLGQCDSVGCTTCFATVCAGARRENTPIRRTTTAIGSHSEIERAHIKRGLKEIKNIRRIDPARHNGGIVRTDAKYSAVALLAAITLTL